MKIFGIKFYTNRVNKNKPKRKKMTFRAYSFMAAKRKAVDLMASNPGWSSRNPKLVIEKSGIEWKGVITMDEKERE